MALIAMAVYCTEDNDKDTYLYKTLDSLEKTVDWDSHRLILSVNSYTTRTKEIIEDFSESNGIFSVIDKVIWNDKNLGTAEAINLAWKERKPGENCVKIDDDVVIHQSGWIEQMEEVFRRDNTIGQVGLKRKDCWESPNRTDFYKSELLMLQHQPGEKWVVVEQVNHVMGTCVMHSAALLDKVGYLYQPSLYGFDDVLMSIRARLSGFKSVFLPHIEIEHIDTGGTPYQKWKENHASEQWKTYHETVQGYKNNTISIYYNPFK